MAVQLPKYTSLVVEDDPASRSYLTLMLEELNVHAIAARSGEQALELVGAVDIDIMLLDIALGAGITGIQLCETLKRKPQYARTPSIAVTAFAREHLSEMEHMCFSDFLPKPYTLDQLKSVLSKYLKLY
jgi:adenylate cyclase